MSSRRNRARARQAKQNRQGSHWGQPTAVPIADLHAAAALIDELSAMKEVPADDPPLFELDRQAAIDRLAELQENGTYDDYIKVHYPEYAMAFVDENGKTIILDRVLIMDLGLLPDMNPPSADWGPLTGRGATFARLDAQAAAEDRRKALAHAEQEGGTADE